MARRRTVQKKILKHIQQYKQLLQAEGLQVSKMLVFGSHAKGTARPDSDIDLAVVSPLFGRDRLVESILLRRLSLQIDSQIEPLPFSPDELNDPYSTIIQEVNQHGLAV